MEWLNYHHLLYFWTVAKRGQHRSSLRRLAARPADNQRSTASIGRSVREKLFIRQGRRLVLTEAGQIVYRYADEIFTLAGN